MRLRTLPVSVAGVTAACALTPLFGRVRPLPAVLCFAFAVLAQISSNFANEYFDFRDGVDKAGRIGPRRGVTEGDISPRSMAAATVLTLGVACCIGLWLIHFGGWLLLPAGIFTALGAMAYSAGPWPLSRHALGEAAVVMFFGVVPVNMVVYIMCGLFFWQIAMVSVGIGLMGANILIVNNYRDRYDDAQVGKNTLATKFGGAFSLRLYLANGLAAILLCIPAMEMKGWLSLIPATVYLVVHVILWRRLCAARGRALNPLLGLTAINLLSFSLLLLI